MRNLRPTVVLNLAAALVEARPYVFDRAGQLVGRDAFPRAAAAARVLERVDAALDAYDREVADWRRQIASGRNQSPKEETPRG